MITCDCNHELGPLLYPTLNLVDVPTARTNLGLGTMAVQNAASVAITGGSITNLTTFDGVTIDGGTY